MRLHENLRKPRITESLEFAKNAVMKVNNAGTIVELSMAELAALDGLAAELALLDGVTATAAEINQAADISEAYEVVTATNVITAAENGKTFFLSAVAGFVSTLPEPAIGLHYKFIVSTAPTSNGYDIATDSGADIMKGLALEAETDTGDDGPTDQNADNLNLAANVAVAGDWVEVVSDGTSWFFRGATAADGGLVPSTT
jgi:hypothetical protein